jgi:Phosphomevalonate kinase
MGTFYIGVGGVARAGKDSFANILLNLLKLDGYNAIRSSLAEPLKQDCQEFIQSKLGLDVWTDDTQQKATFREMLVWYGKVKRKQTEGKYWTDLLTKKVESQAPDVCIVPDVRYLQYPQDEVYWLKEKMGGILIHVQRKDLNGDIIPPANMDESVNDFLVRDNADYQLEWNTVGAEDLYLLERTVKNVYNSFIKAKIHAAKNS